MIKKIALPKIYNIFPNLTERAAQLSARSLPVEVFYILPTGRRPWGKPRTHIWFGNTSGSPRKRLRMWLGRKMSGLLCFTGCHWDLDLDKWQKMNIWVDKYSTVKSLLELRPTGWVKLPHLFSLIGNTLRCQFWSHPPWWLVQIIKVPLEFFLKTVIFRSWESAPGSASSYQNSCR